MAYKFKKLNEGAVSAPLSIQTLFKGVNLGDELTDSGTLFRTLNVTGRGLIDYDMDTDDMDGVDGAFVNSIKAQSRPIVVECEVKANDNLTFRQMYRKLNRILRSTQAHPLKFTDEGAYYFNAYYVGSSNPKEDSNHQIIELNFICHDPKKYRDTQLVSFTNAKVLNLDTDYPVIPEEIVVTFSSEEHAKDWTINNTTNGKRIRFKSDVANSNVVVIRQKENLIKFGPSATINRIRKLVLTYSDFKTFTVDDGDQVVVTPIPTKIEMKYKGVSL